MTVTRIMFSKTSRVSLLQSNSLRVFDLRGLYALEFDCKNAAKSFHSKSQIVSDKLSSQTRDFMQLIATIQQGQRSIAA